MKTPPPRRGRFLIFKFVVQSLQHRSLVIAHGRIVGQIGRNRNCRFAQTDAGKFVFAGDCRRIENWNNAAGLGQGRG